MKPRDLGDGRSSGRIFALSLFIIAINSAHVISAEMPSAGRKAPLDSCLAAANAAWSEPEHAAWRNLCDKQTVNLSQDPHQRLDPSAKGCLATFATSGQKNPDPVIYENDHGRRLSREFFDDILHNYTYSHFLENTPIRIRGAFIPSLYISNALISSLRIDNSLIGDVDLHSIKIDSSISFCDSTTIKNKFVASNINAPKAELYQASVLSNSLYGVDPVLTFENSSFSESLSIVFVKASKIEVISTHVDNS